jgi:hypothetical protein
MEIIKGNFDQKKPQEDTVDKQKQIREALKRLLNETDLSPYDEMVLILNSTAGEGTSISTNCQLADTHFLLCFAAQTLLDGSILLGE